MCLLTFVPEGVQPNAHRLLTGTIYNPDGFGFAIADHDNGKMIVHRGMNADDVVDRFVEVRKHHDGPALFHSRISTGGDITKLNCHPFYVGDDPLTVMAHNGIMPKSAQPRKGERRSDTRIVAERMIPNGSWGHMWVPKSRTRFNNWIGHTYNKVLFLTINPRYKSNHYLFNGGLGTWEDDGCWYSNDSYLPYTVKFTPKYDYGAWECEYDEDSKKWKYASGTWYENGKEGFTALRPRDDCTACLGEDTVDPVTRFCSFCSCCADCDQWREDCDCYVPSSATKLHRELDEIDRQLAERLKDNDDRTESESEPWPTTIGARPTVPALPAAVHDPARSGAGQPNRSIN